MGLCLSHIYDIRWLLKQSKITMAASTYPLASPRFFYGWIVLGACFLTTMMASGTMMAFGVFINPLVEDMGWSHSALSLTYAISAIVSGVGVLAVGSFMHAYSLRTIFVIGVLVHGFGIYMTSTATSVEAFYLWYGFVAALGRSTFFITTTVLITRWFEQRRGMAMGLTMSGNGLGPFVFSPVVTWPSLSTAQPSGIETPLSMATSTLPRAATLVAMSRSNGG